MKTGAVGSGARGMDVRRQGGDPPSGWMEVLVEESQTTTTTSSSAIPNLPLSNNRQRLAGQAVLLLLLRDGDGADADSFFSGSIPNALAVGQARHRPAGNFGGQLLLLLGQHSPHVVPPATSSPLLFRRACLDNCGPIAQPLGCSEDAALAGPCAMIGRRVDGGKRCGCRY